MRSYLGANPNQGQQLLLYAVEQALAVRLDYGGQRRPIQSRAEHYYHAAERRRLFLKLLQYST